MIKKIILLFTSLFFVFSFAVHAAEKQKIVIGATAGDFAELVRDGLKPGLEKLGYQVKLVEFTDYVQPNLALDQGRIDLNIFQHQPYLEQFSKDRTLNLEVVSSVPTAPLGIYAGKLKSLEQVKAGSKIAVPNDPTNLARALLVLSDLGWIELPKSIDATKVTTHDIKKNVKNIKIVELEAAQIPRALNDVDFAVINGNFVASAGISLTSALMMETSNRYINWAVARTSDMDKQFIKDIKTVLNSSEFQKYSFERFKGYKFPADWKKPCACKKDGCKCPKPCRCHENKNHAPAVKS